MTRKISLAHGNGGRLMRELIDDVFGRRLRNDWLDTSADAVVVSTLGHEEVVITTDGFTVQPLEYPGGNIGSLAVHGTVNDLAVGGADPLYLTLNAFLEEGLDLAVLERVVDAMAAAARESGVDIVAGDTKVLRQGECGGIYLATTGVGVRPGRWTSSMASIQPGDAIIVSGTLGDHGAAVMLAREEFGWQGELKSDSASVLPACQGLRELSGLRFMRDPTRGGLATVLNDIARTRGVTVRVNEEHVPISPEVDAVCEILGFDPLYLASEGRVVAVVAADQADQAMTLLERSGAAPRPTLIGHIDAGVPEVVMETGLGGERILDELEEDPLPRIC